VYQVLRDPYWVWCNYHAPQSEAIEETSRYEELQRQRGIEYEHTWVQTRYPEAMKIEPDFGFEALKNTLQAMLDGYPAIYQPHLWDLGRETYGKADLLVRDDTSRSDLGPYRYRLVEIKRSKSLRDHQIIQAAAYNRMLGCTQGSTPDELFVALQETVEKVSHASSENGLDEVLAKWRALRDGQFTPEPGRPPDVTGSPWRVYGNKVVEANQDLVLLAGIGSREREKLRGAGIHRVDQLWNLSLEESSEVLGSHYGPTAYYVAQAYKIGQPISKPKSPLVIPRAKRHLYFDFETSDDVHPTQPPHVYLIGCWDAERSQYVHFLARGAEDEGKIFKQFIEYIGDVPKSKLYHWTGFEIGELHNVIQRWPVMEEALLRLTSSCVDLKEMVKSAAYLPVPTFSLKCVAPALGFRWRQEGFGAFESMVCYWDHLDGADESTIARSILYNEDDCRAMWHVDRELTKRFV
jgi:uncharacterized protein